MKFSVSKNSTYTCTLSVYDKDHVVDLISGGSGGWTQFGFPRSIFDSGSGKSRDLRNNKNWKKTAEGWDIKLPLTIGMLSPADYSVLRKVETYRTGFFIYASKGVMASSKFTHFPEVGAYKAFQITIKK